MEFDESKVYTALNADKLKIGSKVICADNMADLRMRVKTNNFEPTRLLDINTESCTCRFVTEENRYVLAYLVSKPEEKKLEWTDLKVGDVIRKRNMVRMVTGINSNKLDDGYHILIDGRWLDDEKLKEWEKVEK